LLNTQFTPGSAGDTAAAIDPDNNGPANQAYLGDPAFDTADFNNASPGNLPVDYVLPSAKLKIVGAGVFLPTRQDSRFAPVGTFNKPNLYASFSSSGHRAVWVDVSVAAAQVVQSGAPEANPKATGPERGVFENRSLSAMARRPGPPGRPGPSRAGGKFPARAERDPLTGLGNRRHFDRRCAELQPALQRDGEPVALVLVGVDHFKRVNDTHGHEMGDGVLVALAALLRETPGRAMCWRATAVRNSSSCCLAWPRGRRARCMNACANVWPPTPASSRPCPNCA